MIPAMQLGQLGRAVRAARGGPYLDDYSPLPQSALGLRKLISTATVAIRVRRSSDSAEQDIGFSGDLLDTASLASFVGGGSGYVVALYDQTANGENASQSGTTAQPRIVNAGVYDATVKFDGSNDCLIITGLSLATQYVGFYMKGRIYTPASGKVLVESSSNYNNNSNAFSLQLTASVFEPLIHASPNGSNYKANSYSIPLASAAGVVSVLLDATKSGTSEIDVYENGSVLTPTADLTYNITANFTSYDVFIGSRNNASNYQQFDASAMAFYNADTSSIRASIEAVIGA